MNSDMRGKLGRAYYRVLSLLPLNLRRRVLFFLSHQRRANLRDPRSFSEKVNWRIINDRRTLLQWTCDKDLSKGVVKEICPDIRFPTTIWIGHDINELSKVSLPDHWVLKPNHRSGLVYFGSGNLSSVQDVRDLTRGWLDDFQSRALGEWAYSEARPLLLIEERIGEPHEVPADYKFLVFDGRAALAQVERSRFGGAANRNFYWLPGWSDAGITKGKTSGAAEPPPSRLQDMIAAAEKIGSAFDFVRVDLYLVGEQIYFGEVSPYPAGGLKPFEPYSADLYLGGMWKLPNDIT